MYFRACAFCAQVSVCACVCVCAHLCTFGCISVCLSALSRCAGMAVCCNASCFANCLRSAETGDAKLSGDMAKIEMTRNIIPDG